MGDRRHRWTARPGRRPLRAPVALLAGVTATSLLVGGLALTASAAPAGRTAGSAPSTATTTKATTTRMPAATTKPATKKPATKKPATKKPATKKPAGPTTLGALAAAMDKAIQAAGTVTYAHSTVVTGTPSNMATGVVTWTGGAASFDVTERFLSGYGERWIALPDVTYRRDEGSIDPDAEAAWETYRTDSTDRTAVYDLQRIALMRQQMNPARLFPGRALAALKVIPGKPATVGGVKCSVRSVRMTGVQAYGSYPSLMRPEPMYQAGTTVTTTFYLDPAGLPRKVVVVYGSKSGSYSEISTFTRWGSPVTVQAPEL